MRATRYSNVPARVWRGRKGTFTTAMYRKIMAEIDRCIRSGGAVDCHQTSHYDPGMKPGHIVERISFTLDWTPETAQ